MNPNENHEAPLTQQIDRLIETHHPIGVPVADDFAATIPQARPDFQQQLEDRLTAQIQFASQGDEKLAVRTTSISNASRSRRSYIPLTLAVAMVAVILVGSVLLSSGGKAPDLNLALLIDETVTPTPQATPVRMVNVVIALQNLSRGYRFPSTIAELGGIVGYAPWPESAVPLSALVQDQNGLEQLAGRVLRTDVFREQIILTSTLAADPTHTLVPAPISAAGLISNRVAIALPINLLTGMTDAVQVGVQVDISALVTFMGGKNSHLDVMLQKIVRNARVMHLGDYTPAILTATSDMLILSVLRDEAETLAWLVSAEIPMTLELSADDSSTPIVDQPIPEWHDSRSMVTIPIQQIISLVGDGVQEGDHVGITAEFIFANVKGDNTLQVIPTNVPGIMMSTPIPKTLTVSKVIVEDAEVMSINSDDNTVTVAVSSQEENTLRWLLDAKIPLALKPIDPNYLSTIAPPVLAPEVTISNAEATANPSGFQPGLIPPGQRGAEIDRDLITNDLSSFKANDTVDIAISFLTINKNPEFASDPGVDNTTMPDNAYVATKTVFTNVKILTMGGIRNQADTHLIAVALNPEDADLLTWILAAHMPIALSVAHSDANDLTVENLADGKVTVEIPVKSLTSEEGYIQASNTVNILARMNFTNYDPNDPGSLEPRKLVSQIIVRDAEMTSSSGTVNAGDVMRVKLIIAQDELSTLEWALKANIPLTLQLRPK